MLRKLLAMACFVLSIAGANSAHAADTGWARVITSCGTISPAYKAGDTFEITMDVTGKLCTSSAGGGGGLSVTDQASWTQGTSAFTPSGGVFSDTATLTSGQEGTVRLTAQRAMHVDIDSTNNQLHTDLTAATPAGSNRIGYVSDDPCSQLTKSGATINLTASGQVITGTAAKKTYICSIDLVISANENIALVEGTGTTCATNIFGLAGGTTAATGWNLTTNGLVKGNGSATVYSPSADTNATAANVCLLASSTSQISGQITYVQN